MESSPLFSGCSRSFVRAQNRASCRYYHPTARCVHMKGMTCFCHISVVFNPNSMSPSTGRGPSERRFHHWAPEWGATGACHRPGRKLVEGFRAGHPHGPGFSLPGAKPQGNGPSWTGPESQQGFCDWYYLRTTGLGHRTGLKIDCANARINVEVTRQNHPASATFRLTLLTLPKGGWHPEPSVSAQINMTMLARSIGGERSDC